MHLEKNWTYACTFPVQRKEINVVKVRFTMRYSSRKLSNDKVITTACNFWRQIACTFQVISGNTLFLGKKIFEIPPFFQTRPRDLGKKVHACSLRFSALKFRMAMTEARGARFPRKGSGNAGPPSPDPVSNTKQRQSSRPLYTLGLKTALQLNMRRWHAAAGRLLC